jgi:phosphoenolpyruvate synthase/pyruvate phosphate dikinase
MTKPMVRIHNSETDEVIDREMTAAEIKIYEKEKAAEAAKLAEAETKAAEKQALLDRLGLTADEAKLLLG